MELLKQSGQSLAYYFKYGNLAEVHPESPKTVWEVKGIVGGMSHLAKNFRHTIKCHLESQALLKREH